PLYNPAFSGIEGYRDLKLGYRYQWTGFGSDAPKFINATFNFRIKEPLDLTLNALRTSLAKSQNNEIPKIKRVIHGMGVNIFQEQFGLIKKLGGGINYSFHYPITKQMRLALGVGAMLENTKIDLNGVYFGIDPNDPNKGPIDPKSDPLYQSLLSSGSAFTNLNIRAGFLLYASRYYFGFSYLPLANFVIQDNETDLSASYYRGVIQAGYSFPISATTDIKPSILALWQDGNKFIIDYNVKVYIDQKIWFGLTYRDVKSMVGIIGFNLNEMLGASYSYELSANNLHQFGGGSHELVLSLRLNNFKRQRQLTW
ncbi:MAG TPA: PorP/SprF family type IX secretion system membrane protein, partial [Chryseolinea sp.]